MQLISFRICDGPSDLEQDLSRSGVQTFSSPPVYLDETEGAVPTKLLSSALIGPGSAGCWLAHHNLWVKIASEFDAETRILILEEDSRISKFGIRNIDKVFKLSLRRNIGLLHVGAGFPHEILPSSASHDSGGLAKHISCLLEAAPPLVLRGFRWRTHAYMVSARAAGALAECGPDLSMPVDEWLMTTSTKFPFKTRFVRQALFLPDGRSSKVDLIGR